MLVDNDIVIKYIMLLIHTYPLMYAAVTNFKLAKKDKAFQLVEKSVSFIHTWMYLLTLDINMSIAYYVFDLGVKVLMCDWQMIIHHLLTLLALLQPSSSPDYANIIRYYIYMKLGDTFIYIPKLIRYSRYENKTLYTLSWWATAITWGWFRCVMSFTDHPTTNVMIFVYSILQCVNFYWMHKIIKIVRSL